MINQSYTPSSNGLESFIEASPDYELAPIGLGSMRDQAEKLAEYGRYGDIYVVHAAEGETVVPMEVLEANPKIKSLLFDQMSQMGLDPERYVVGNDLNSLNPVTGMPEFFFKKLWKSVKKVLPMVAPIIGNMIAPGIGGLIATGLTTKLSGGSWGDALKATAMAWGTQAVLGGVGNWSKPGGFSKGFMQGARAPLEAGAGLLSWDGTTPRADNPLAQGIGSGLLGTGSYDWENKGLLPEYDPEHTIPELSYMGNPKTGEFGGRPSAREAAMQPVSSYSEEGITYFPEVSPAISKTTPALDTLPGPSPVRKEIARLENEIGAQLTPAQRLDVAKEYAASADKGPLLGKYSPSKFLGLSEEGSDVYDLGLGLGATYLLGGFDEDEPEQPEPEDLAGVVDPEVTGATLLAADPDRFRIGVENLNPNIPVLGETEIPSMFAAQGGTVNYPRRIGQITGPGTGTSDSIPAMLSNGEFVMTKRAVDGAGGPGTMYDMMRNFEMRT